MAKRKIQYGGLVAVVLLYMNFRNMVEVAIKMGTLPLAMVSSIWPENLIESMELFSDSFQHIDTNR